MISKRRTVGVEKTELHGGVDRQTSTPRKSGNKMKKKKKKKKNEEE